MNKSRFNANDVNTKIVLSNTYLSGFYNAIDKIKQQINSDPNQSIILIVPDKFSLNAEQIFMERTGLSSIFNVWLTTLSRFINKVIEDSGNALPILSKNSGVMLVSQISLENSDKISTYKKIANNYSLAETMYNVINLLKSSGVKPEELKQNLDNTNLGLKVKDIYTVYSEYEKRMKDNIDAITRLDIFNQKVKFNEYVKSSHVYFAMFDSFTNVQYNSIANLAKNVKSLTISFCENTTQSNSYIYDNSVYQRMRSFFDDHNVNYSVEKVKHNGTEMQNYLVKNLFTTQEISNENKLNTDYIKLIECSKITEEVRYVASKIKYLVIKKGLSFNDINVAVNGLNDYSFVFKDIFNEFDLPFYIDNNRTMLEHYFTRALFKIAEFVLGQKTLNNAMCITESPIFTIEQKI